MEEKNHQKMLTERNPLPQKSCSPYTSPPEQSKYKWRPGPPSHSHTK